MRAQNQLPAPGMWREHAPYQSAIDLAASDNKIYVATVYNLFSIDRISKETERFSKVSGLSETGISTINFEPTLKKLVIAYSNSNIDIIDQKGIHNVPGIKRANIAGDKNIYNIYPDGQLQYLSTGLGVIVLDVVRFEIRSTWYLGNGGNSLKTNGFTKHGGKFYAATEDGLKGTAVNNNNPASFSNWQQISGTNGLPAGPAKAVVNLSDKLLVLVNDSVYILNGNNWQLFYADGWPVINMNVSEGKLFLAQRNANDEARVTVLNDAASVEAQLSKPVIISNPLKVIKTGNEYWVADMYGGLSHWSGNNIESIRPNSPENIALGELKIYNGILYAPAGTVNDAWNYQYNRSGIFRMENSYWTTYNQFQFPALDTLLDFITIAIDPRDESMWAGSFGGGLLQKKVNGEIKVYKQNSPLQPAVGDPTSYRVAGLAFDQQDNLWISNYGSQQQLHVLKNDGTWRSFVIPFFITESAVSQVLIDDAGQKWIVSPKNNGLIVFNDNNTIDDLSDDRWKIYRQGTGAGSLPSSDVTSIAKDRSGFIWVGTMDGIGVIQCPESVFLNGCEAVLPTIREGGFTNYLFKGESIRSIAVDGADRKWVATAGGVWLVNAEGNKVLSHFNESNSPLLSNDVKSIAVDGRSGEVFFATAKGISSFRGTATDALENDGNVLVFPNPVPPQFTGSIAIRGLPDNSIFKIIESNGRLVYQSRSLGGQAIWNGQDYRGRKAASGVYIIMAIDEFSREKAVGKIVLTGR
jgi:hypothetical protein